MDGLQLNNYQKVVNLSLLLGQSMSNTESFDANDLRVEKGRQAYVICPLIESSEHLEDVQNVVALYESLQQYYGVSRVGLLHGKLSADEKDEVMQKFSNHEIDVLVSTTVVEVGVNVPNATFMMIYDADRFGLSTLHQLRGRVGRSDQQSYCVLIASPKQKQELKE